MVSLVHEGSRCSAKISPWFSSFQPLLLAVLRLHFGWTLAGSGWNKLHNIGGTADYFAGLGIPLPVASAWCSGGAEWLGGICLALGAFSRPVASILIGNFLVAYITAHRAEAWALFTHPHDFVTAPPFLYLLTSALVLVFGPGVFSVDHLLLMWAKRRKGIATSGGPAGEAIDLQAGPATESREIAGQPINRRTSVALVVSSLAGVVAGAKLANMARGRETTPTAVAQGGGEPQGEAASGLAAKGPATEKDLDALNAFDRDAPAGVMPTLLTVEPHVCCGLNTCKGTSKSGDNACAGQGACATATTHGCQGLNDCKGQGGCGQHPGQNTCEGKGSCAVPLKKPQWDLARPLFEKLMPLSGRSVGRAPANCPKASA